MAKVLGVGFSTSARDDPDFDLLRRDLDTALELGVEFVELPLFTMDIIAGGRVLDAQVRRLKEALASRLLRFTVHGPIALNLMQAADLVQRHMTVAKATIEICAEIGALHLVLHTGTIRSQDPSEIDTAYAGQRDAFAELGDMAATHNLIIAVENIFATQADEHTALPSRLASEIVAINHPNIRACVDFSHGAITSTAQEADFLKEVRALAPLARHLHIHDSFGDPAHLRTYSRSERVAYGLSDLHLPIGWGNIPWPKIMSEVAFEADTIFNIELPGHFAYALPDCVASVREMIRTYELSRAQTDPQK